MTIMARDLARPHVFVQDVIREALRIRKEANASNGVVHPMADTAATLLTH